MAAEYQDVLRGVQMAKYRKKPVVIDAVQWDGKNLDDVLELADQVPAQLELPEEGDHLLIRTLEGIMRAEPNDWIIRGVKGELYPCKPDIFAATYDAA
jgi:hypothetical protein